MAKNCRSKGYGTKVEAPDSNKEGGVRGCRTHLPPINISKLHAHVEQFSLKTNWRVAERLLYNQGCKKDYGELIRKGREEIRSEPVALGGDSEEKGDYMGRDLPWDVSV